MTSVLVPWNTCGAYISGVLGVSTASYFPYCFFNLLSPILDVVYGFIGFKVPSAPTTAAVLPEPSQPAAPGVAVDFGGDAGDSGSSSGNRGAPCESGRERLGPPAASST